MISIIPLRATRGLVRRTYERLSSSLRSSSLDHRRCDLCDGSRGGRFWLSVRLSLRLTTSTTATWCPFVPVGASQRGRSPSILPGPRTHQGERLPWEKFPEAARKLLQIGAQSQVTSRCLTRRPTFACLCLGVNR